MVMHGFVSMSKVDFGRYFRGKKALQELAKSFWMISYHLNDFCDKDECITERNNGLWCIQHSSVGQYDIQTEEYSSG